MHTERGSLGAGAGILGLLIVVAIILYLMVGPMGGGAGGGGAAGGGGGGGTSYLGAVKNTRDQGFEVKIETLAYSLDQMIAAHVLANGDEYPNTLAELDAPPGAFHDPWKNDITFTIDEVNKELTVTSGGPDGQVGTADDIVHTRPLSL